MVALALVAVRAELGTGDVESASARVLMLSAGARCYMLRAHA